MILNQAENICLGEQEAQAVFIRSQEVWRRSGGNERRGQPPLLFPSDGSNLLDWSITGAIGGVGNYNGNYLKQAPVTLPNGQTPGTQYAGDISYRFATYGPSIPSGTFVADEQQWLQSSYSKIITIGSNRMGVDDRAVSYDNCQYKCSLGAGSYKLIMEAFDHSGQWLSDQLSQYPSSDNWRGVPKIAILDSNNNTIVEEDFDRTLYQGSNYIHLEFPFTLSESKEVGLFFRGMGHRISSEEFLPRFMIVDSDTIAEEFSATYGSITYQGVSCWKPFECTIPIIISSGNQSQTININIDAPLGQSDTISKTSTGIDIPTYSGKNRIDVNTTVTPSEVYIKFSD